MIRRSIIKDGLLMIADCILSSAITVMVMGKRNGCNNKRTSYKTREVGGYAKRSFVRSGKQHV